MSHKQFTNLKKKKDYSEGIYKKFLAFLQCNGTLSEPRIIIINSYLQHQACFQGDHVQILLNVNVSRSRAELRLAFAVIRPVGTCK